MANNIRTIRLIRQISAHDLAKKAGLTRQTLYNMENDYTHREHVEVGTLKRLAKALNVTCEMLYDDNFTVDFTTKNPDEAKAITAIRTVADALGYSVGDFCAKEFRNNGNTEE